MSLIHRDVPLPDVPDGRLLALVGEVEAKASLLIEETVAAHMKGGVSRLILDLADVEIINSTGMGTLIKIADRLREAGGYLALARTPKRVSMVFETFGIDAFFQMFDSREAAVAYLANPESVEP